MCWTVNAWITEWMNAFVDGVLSFCCCWLMAFHIEIEICEGKNGPCTPCIHSERGQGVFFHHPHTIIQLNYISEISCRFLLMFAVIDGYFLFLPFSEHSIQELLTAFTKYTSNYQGAKTAEISVRKKNQKPNQTLCAFLYWHRVSDVRSALVHIRSASI